MGAFSTERGYALELDAADPLSHLRDRFVIDHDPRGDPEPIYLDGNSLGRLSTATRRRLAEVVDDEWGRDLVRSWSHWIELPERVGDQLGADLLGAAAGQVVVSDSTTVNLYKLATAALDASPGRRVLVTDDDNFPTDRYVFEGIAAQRGLELRMIHADPDQGVSAAALREAVDEDTALVSLSHVAYRSGALLDMAEINELVHRRGALMMWDLCHSAGSVPIELDATGADLAVGCTYKYLNAGPGAPAFLYVRRDRQTAMRQPIWGWFGQRDQFAMGPAYDPEPSIARFATGTPTILGLIAVEEGVRLLAEAGIDRLRAKGVALTSYLIALADAWLPELTLATPRDPARRGAHVSLHHPEAWRIAQALVDAGVIPDYRTPDRVRLGPAPINTSFTDVHDAMARLREIVETKSYDRFAAARSRVT
jgi:kynureninase